jgi:hypothetical protein
VAPRHRAGSSWRGGGADKGEGCRGEEGNEDEDDEDKDEERGGVPLC